MQTVNVVNRVRLPLKVRGSGQGPGMFLGQPFLFEGFYRPRARFLGRTWAYKAAYYYTGILYNADTHIA